MSKAPPKATSTKVPDALTAAIDAAVLKMLASAEAGSKEVDSAVKWYAAKTKSDDGAMGGKLGLMED